MNPLKDLNVKDIMSQPDSKNKKSGKGGLSAADIAAFAPMAMKFLTPKIKVGIGLALFFLIFGIGSFFYNLPAVIDFILYKPVLYYVILSYFLSPVFSVVIHFKKIKGMKPKTTISEFSKNYEWRKLFDILYPFSPIVLPERILTLLISLKK